MGVVVPLSVENSASRYGEGLIASMYAKLADALPDFRIKSSQVKLSESICRSFVDNVPLAAEAPTGIGKTLAYLIGGLAAREILAHSGTQLPLVVATGTVALQEQVARNDLPKLVAAGAIRPLDFMVLKGRGRYFCPLYAERFAGNGGGAFQLDMFSTGADDLELETARVEARPMLASFLDRKWDGEFDSWAAGCSSRTRELCSATADSCLGRGCAYAESCPFRASRRRAAESPVVIVNHDLLLLDLAAARSAEQGGDGAEVLPLGNYLLVVDEAHHLPDKALEHLSAKISFNHVQALLDAVPEWVGTTRKFKEAAALLAERGVGADTIDVEPAKMALGALREHTEALEADDSGYHLFIGGKLADGLAERCMDLAVALQVLGQTLSRVAEVLKSSRLPERHPRLASVVYGLTAQAAAKGTEFARIGEHLVRIVLPDADSGRWCKPGHTLEASPLEAGKGLYDILWSARRVRPVMVSATLRDFDGLRHFRQECGFPETGRELVLPYVFNYKKSLLEVVRLQAPPTFDTIDSWIAELEAALPRYIDPDEGTLILFPSRDLMLKMRGPVERERPGGLWQDGTVSVPVLKELHCRRVLEEGRGSYVAGLATLAEGLDLPGKLCTHVIIVKLPFSAPSDPLSRLRQARYRGAYFKEQVLPTALRRLNQQVGRLLRRDTDSGRVTVFDSRLVTTHYGNRLLKALPPFTVKVSQAG